MFFRIWVFLNSHEVPCGISDIFSWQTIWDLSKIFSALRKSKISLTCTISQNQHFMSVSGWIYCQFTWFIVLFGIWIFWIITRCLVGSQIFFLDKQSETCQNKFQLWGNQNSIGHMQLIIIATLCLLYGHLSSIWDYILCFLDFECFLDNHEVSCGISDIFPWQTIWDLSK